MKKLLTLAAIILFTLPSCQKKAYHCKCVWPANPKGYPRYIEDYKYRAEKGCKEMDEMIRKSDGGSCSLIPL